LSLCRSAGPHRTSLGIFQFSSGCERPRVALVFTKSSIASDPGRTHHTQVAIRQQHRRAGPGAFTPWVTRWPFSSRSSGSSFRRMRSRSNIINLTWFEVGPSRPAPSRSPCVPRNAVLGVTKSLHRPFPGAERPRDRPRCPWPRFQCHCPRVKVQAYFTIAWNPGSLPSFRSELIAVDDLLAGRLRRAQRRVRGQRRRPLSAATCPRTSWLCRARNARLEERPATIALPRHGLPLTPTRCARSRPRQEAGRPYVLVFDYARTFWSGGPTHKVAAQFDRTGPAPFRLRPPRLPSEGSWGLEQGRTGGIRRSARITFPPLLRGHPVDLPGP